MALKQCKECGKEVSTQAESCPNCGAKNKPFFGKYSWGCLIFIIGGAFILPGMCSTPSYNNYKERAEQIKKEAENIPLTEKGKKVKAKHQDWKNDICNTIGDKKIRIGMTSEQVKAAWGKPYKINTTEGKYGTHEQWVMQEYGSEYVYFENGIMTSLQQSK